MRIFLHKLNDTKISFFETNLDSLALIFLSCYNHCDNKREYFYESRIYFQAISKRL